MSSSCSSSMTWTTSSTVIAPTSRPLSSTTGAEARPYCRNRNATSSWSIIAGIGFRSAFMMSDTSTGRSVRSSRLTGNAPIGR